MTAFHILWVPLHKIAGNIQQEGNSLFSIPPCVVLIQQFFQLLFLIFQQSVGRVGNVEPSFAPFLFYL